MAKIVQKIDKLSNSSLQLGLLNPITLENVKVGEVNGLHSANIFVTEAGTKVPVATVNYVDNSVATLNTSLSTAIQGVQTYVEGAEANLSANIVALNEATTTALATKVDKAQVKVNAKGDYISDDDGDAGIISLTGNWSAETQEIALTASHKSFTTEGTVTEGEALPNGSLVVTGINRDTYGHITGYTTSKLAINGYNGFKVKSAADDAGETVVSDGSLTVIGTNKISVVRDGTALTVAHEGVSVNVVTPEDAAAVEIKPGSSNSIITVPAVAYDSYGHITGITNSKYSITVPTFTVNAAGATSEPAFVSAVEKNEHGVTVTKTAIVTENLAGAEANSLVSAGAIKKFVTDSIGEAASGMEYQGTVSALPSTSGLMTGAFWKVGAGFQLPAANSGDGKSYTLKEGDIIILNKEGTFDYVPSADEIYVDSTVDFTTGNIVVADGAKSIKTETAKYADLVKRNESAVAQTEDAIITVSASSPVATESGGITTSTTTYTVDHKKSTVTAGSYGAAEASTALKFNVPSVTVDAYGHVTAAKDSEIDLTSTVQGLVDAVALSSDDFKIEGKKINIDTTASANKLSKDGATLTWGGSDLKIGSASVAKVGTLDDSKNKTLAAIDVSGKTVGQSAFSVIDSNVSGASQWASDTNIPTANAITLQIQSKVDEVTAGASSAIRTLKFDFAATQSSVEFANAVPSGSVINRVILEFTTKSDNVSITGNLKVGDKVIFNESVDYIKNETARYIFEPYTASAGSIQFTELSGAAGSVFVEYSAPTVLTNA